MRAEKYQRGFHVLKFFVLTYLILTGSTLPLELGVLFISLGSCVYTLLIDQYVTMKVGTNFGTIKFETIFYTLYDYLNADKSEEYQNHQIMLLKWIVFLITLCFLGGLLGIFPTHCIPEILFEDLHIFRKIAYSVLSLILSISCTAVISGIIDLIILLTGLVWFLGRYCLDLILELYSPPSSEVYPTEASCAVIPYAHVVGFIPRAPTGSQAAWVGNWVDRVIGSLQSQRP